MIGPHPGGKIPGKVADPSGTWMGFPLLIPLSVEREGGVFSEYHCYLHCSTVKQISSGGSIHPLWDRAARLTQRLTQHPLQLTLLTIHLNLLPPAHKSLLRLFSSPPWLEAAEPHPSPSHVSSLAGGLCDCYLQDFCVTGKWKYH